MNIGAIILVTILVVLVIVAIFFLGAPLWISAA